MAISSKIDRRRFLILAGTGLATTTGFAQEGLPPQVSGEGSAAMPRVIALFSYARGTYYFNPVGLHIEVGQTVEWVGVGRRSVTAFHPSIDNHELRIPENARPFDSRTMAPGENSFRWTFNVEGTYDYYSAPHEYLGMVGRVVVGKPGGPGEESPGYGNREGHTVMYSDSAKLLNYLKSAESRHKKNVPFPQDLLAKSFPWR